MSSKIRILLHLDSFDEQELIDFEYFLSNRKQGKSGRMTQLISNYREFRSDIPPQATFSQAFGLKNQHYSPAYLRKLSTELLLQVRDFLALQSFKNDDLLRLPALLQNLQGRYPTLRKQACDYYRRL